MSMSSSIMNGDESVRGAVTSGGTESILLAMKTYRDYYRSTRGINNPEVILPTSAHAAFLKACDYFCIKPVFLDLDKNYVADTEKIKELITPNTIALVGSANRGNVEDSAGIQYRNACGRLPWRFHHSMGGKTWLSHRTV